MEIKFTFPQIYKQNRLLRITDVLNFFSMNEKFLTAKEAAERLKVKPITVRVWLTKGLFPNAKLDNMPPFGDIWRIPESDIKSFAKPIMGRPKKEKND